MASDVSPTRADLASTFVRRHAAWVTACGDGSDDKTCDDLALDAWNASQAAVLGQAMSGSNLALRFDLLSYLQKRHLRHAGDLAQSASAHLVAATWFAEMYNGQFIHVHELGWMFWSGKVWTLDPGGKLAVTALLETLRTHEASAILAGGKNKKFVQAQVKLATTGGGIKSTMFIAATLPGFRVDVDQLDAQPFQLNTANGVLDLKTLTLHDHNPRFYHTRITKGAYDPSATSSLWTSFLERVLPDPEVREYLRRYIGVSLHGSVTAELLPILHGAKGRNGKSKFYEAVCHCLGDYAITPEPDLLMVRNNAHPAGEMDLRGTRLAVISENNEGRVLASATVKRLTGGDTIRARYMRQDFVEFTPTHNLLLITNHLPTVKGDDPAIWSRIRVIPFEVQIPEKEQDLSLGIKLRQEADAILTWAVDGLRQFMDAGEDLMTPAIVKLATTVYESDSDDLARWLDACCVVDLDPAAQLKEQAANLFNSWSAWCHAEGVQPGTQTAFGRRLNSLGVHSKKSTGGYTVRLGIRLLTSIESDGLADESFSAEEN